MSDSAVVPTPTVALSAEAFDQSIGVNVHMWEWGEYTVSLTEACLAYLGVENVRDLLFSNSLAGLQALAADGYKIDAAIAPPNNNISYFVTMVDTFNAAYPGSLKAIEGANEVNIFRVTYNGGSTIADAALYQQALYTAVRADPTLDNIPVYNTTIGSAEASLYSALGNLSSSANYANVHPYAPDSSTPGSFLEAFLPLGQLDAPGLRTVITETGYDTDPNDGYSGVDETVQAKYTLDTLMDAFKAGVPQTYLYELMDDASDPTDSNPQDHFGLFNSDGTPKLAATAIHNLTTILADPGYASSFTPGSLSYAVPNLPANANQLLLEQSNGTFDLVLWAEAQIWNSTTQSEIVAPTETTTVNFGQTEKSVEVFDPLQGTTPIAVYFNVASISVALTDHPLIIEISNPASTVSSVTASGGGITNGSGDLDAGQVVTLTVNLSEAVTVAGGTPTLPSTMAARRSIPAGQALMP